MVAVIHIKEKVTEMDLDILKLGKALKKIRLERNMTLNEVALYLGVTHKAVQHWEQGKNEIKMSHFVGLCNLYNISPNDIFDRADFE